MPESDHTIPPSVAARRPARRTARAALAACLIALATAGLAGCYARASAAPSISLSTAYVPQPSAPGRTVAYLIIRNNGGRDRLVSARTSVGGQVTFQAAGPDGAADPRTISSIPIPADATVRLVPNGLHLLITGAGRMRGGRDITLTLTFAHAGAVSVEAQVTNPQTGGSSYFLN
jgi:periplasmic copper chaperone A